MFNYPSSDDFWGEIPAYDDVSSRMIIEEVDVYKTGVLDEYGNEIEMRREKKIGFIHFD